MTAQKGKDILLKIGDGAASESFATVAGLRTKTLSLNARAIDITNASSDGWRELLAGAGIKQASIAGAGVFLDDAAAAEIRTVFFAGNVRTWQVVLPDFGVIEGAFLISNLDYAGDHAREMTVSLALESAGTLSFTEAS